jgi:hypothetical protein
MQMESTEALPGIALLVVLNVRLHIEQARSAEALSDVQTVLEEIDRFMVALHEAADAARMEIEEGDHNAQRS